MVRRLVVSGLVLLALWFAFWPRFDSSESNVRWAIAHDQFPPDVSPRIAPANEAELMWKGGVIHIQGAAFRRLAAAASGPLAVDPETERARNYSGVGVWATLRPLILIAPGQRRSVAGLDLDLSALKGWRYDTPFGRALAREIPADVLDAALKKTNRR